MTHRTFLIRLRLNASGPDYFLTGFSPTTGEPIWAIDRPLARQYDGPTLRLAWNRVTRDQWSARIENPAGELLNVTILENLPDREPPLNQVTC